MVATARRAVFLNVRRDAESIVIKVEVIDVESDGFRDAGTHA